MRAERRLSGASMIFRNDLQVDVHEVDYNGVARASSLMKYMQTAAQLQLTENGMSYDRLRDRHRAFILSRITMEFTETVRAYDRLSALTFPCESRGFSFLRCYALERGGITIGRAVSVWALIDTEEKSLIRVNNFELGLTTHEPHGLALSRFALPHNMEAVGEYAVTYGDTDQNMHMNNTRYPDMYASFLPLSGKRIHTITISYLNEAPFGAVLKVERGVDERGVYYFRTLREDGKINTEAEVFLVDI